MYASVREYLQELEESGVDGLPLDLLQQVEMPDTRGSEQQPVQQPATKPQTLAELCQRIGDCQRCDLHHGHYQPGLWAGYEEPAWCLWKAPGADEDRQGQPFVGEAGQFLRPA